MKGAQQILQVDFHTGLGRKSDYLLFPVEPIGLECNQWLINSFGANHLETWKPQGISYPINGDMGKWCQAMFPQSNYKFLTVEFGTYPSIKVVKALRAENCAHWWGNTESSSYQWAKQLMLDVFAPSDYQWRSSVVAQGLHIVQRALEAMSASSN